MVKSMYKWEGPDSTCDAIVGVAGDMAVHHIQQHMQPQPVRFINQSLQPTTRLSSIPAPLGPGDNKITLVSDGAKHENQANAVK